MHMRQRPNRPMAWVSFMGLLQLQYILFRKRGWYDILWDTIWGWTALVQIKKIHSQHIPGLAVDFLELHPPSVLGLGKEFLPIGYCSTVAVEVNKTIEFAGPRSYQGQLRLPSCPLP